ncbi:MAG: hypothetical protein HY653_00585 [Acidobacteria bacterium]|nr:hypothetical protein [Acidobacteriota bacterium]
MRAERGPGRRWVLALAGLSLACWVPSAALAQSDEAQAIEETIQVLRNSHWAQERFILINTGRLTRRPFIVGRQRETHPGLAPERLPAVYLVRWESAEPVARAFARLEELGERALAEFLARPPDEPDDLEGDHYVITVKAKEPPVPLTYDILARFTVEELQAQAELKTAHGKSVQAARAVHSGLEATAAVHFYFPRDVGGAPLIVPDEDWVEFSFAGRNQTTLKVRFKKEAVAAP